ncbi:hypothetical protein ACIRQP_37110 [Streptomyces sp. NPDC102274]|uniref:hypothetical protein n=1 Tax=Streptomyces sp. NPDC102274 TaxID=3366151 RepID=UPI003814631D
MRERDLPALAARRATLQMLPGGMPLAAGRAAAASPSRPRGHLLGEPRHRAHAVIHAAGTTPRGPR